MVIFTGLFQAVRLSKWYLHFDTPFLFILCLILCLFLALDRGEGENVSLLILGVDSLDFLLYLVHIILELLDAAVHLVNKAVALL